MTTWTDADGGRARGLRAIALAWFTVIVRPREFFRAAVTPGDQAPGLVFLMVVVAVEELVRIGSVPGALPVFAESTVLSLAFYLGLAVLLVAPAALHLGAAAQTLLLMVFAPDRGGISETVQVIAYASAPCVIAGLPSPVLRVAVTTYAFVLMVVGFSERHNLSLVQSTLLSMPLGAAIFGYGFRGFTAAAALFPGLS